MNQKTGLLSSDFILASSASFLLRMSMQFKVTLIPIYIISLGMTKVQAGFAMTVFTIFALVLRPFCGILIDKTGRKSMLIFGIVLFSVSTFPIGFSGNLYIIYLMQAISGIGFSIQSIALTTMITDIVPDNKLTEGLGYFGLTATLAQAAGPFMAASGTGTVSYKILFILAGITMFVSIISSLFISYEKSMIVTTGEDTNTNGLIDKIVERKALLPSMLMGCLSLAGASQMNFLVPFAQLKNISGIGMFFIGRAIGVLLSRLFVGRVERRYGTRPIIGVGITLVVIGIACISIFRVLPPLVIGALLFGIGFGAAHLLFNVIAVRNSPKNRRAYANATYYLAMDVGVGVGSSLWGAIGDFAGMEYIFIIAAIFTFAVLIIFKFSKIK